MRPNWLTWLAVLAFVTTPAQAAWQLTQFELYWGKPSKAANWLEEENAAIGNLGASLLDDATELLGDDSSLATEVESFLHEAAEELASMGFADPLVAGYFDSVVRRSDGSQAIRVYINDVNAPKSPYAWYSSGAPCSEPPTPRKIIRINSLKFAPDGHITDMDFETLAHELFHAVQFSSEYSRKLRCNGPTWLTEGTADAIGVYLAKKLRKVQFKKEYTPGNSQILKVVGGRSYSRPLHRPSEGDDYLTSSFWRYLAEQVHASRNGKEHPGSAATPEDYRYLVNFFKKPWDVPTRPEGQLTWLNARMMGETHIRGDLAHLYPKFTASFADHMAARIGEKLGGLGGGRIHKWLLVAFGNCNSAGSVGKGSTANLSLKIQPVASRCFNVNVLPGTLKKNVLIQIMHDDKAKLEQLQIGLPDGTDVREPLILSAGENSPPHIALWDFPNFFGNAGTYIISNVAKSPDQTKPVDLHLEFSTSDWDSSMTDLPVAPPVPPEAKPQPGKKRPTQRERQKQAMKQVQQNPAAHLGPITEVKRSKNTGGCDPDRQRLNLCGPQLTIKLELGLFDTPLEFSDPTGSGLGSVGPDSTSLLGWMDTFAQLERELEGRDGSRITITIPAIDYGFAGSFENASITVNKADTKDRGYLSYGPPAPIGNRKIWRPPNGKVTITRYSQLAIEGTFSAELVDDSLRESAKNPVVARTISGHFFVPAPALTDDRYDISMDNIMDGLIQNMIQETPFGTEVIQQMINSSGVTPGVLCKKGVSDEQIRAIGFSQGCSEIEGGELDRNCRCACEEQGKEESIPACAITCKREWETCKKLDEPLSAELSAQIADYRSHLEAQDLPPEIVDSLVTTFRDMPQWQRDITLQGFR